MSQRYQKEENELLFTREVICQMIERAYLDAISKTNGFMRNHTSNVATKHQDDAIYFLKSKGFEQLCDAIGVSHSKIRNKAFLTQR